MKTPPPLTTTEVQLEQLRVGLVQEISKELLGVRCGIDQVSDFIRDSLRLQVHGFVWAEKESARHQEIKYPCDWWAAFKVRWFPQWALRRWPAEYKKIVIDVKAIYPEFRPALPKEPLVLCIQREDVTHGPFYRGH